MGKKARSQSQEVTPAPQFAFVSNDEPVALGNVFVVAHLQEEFLVVVGQAAPILAGSIEDGNVVAQQGQMLPIRTVARFMVTETRMQELIDNLQTSLENAKKAREKGV